MELGHKVAQRNFPQEAQVRTAENRNTIVVIDTDRGKLGPCMLALTEKQRKFVWAMLDSGSANYTKCAAAAGYSTESMNSLRVTAHTLAHDERIQAAIQEEARKRMTAGAIMATSHLVTIADSPGHKDQLRAIQMLLDRSGLHSVTEQKVSVTHSADKDTLLREIAAMAREQGLDPQKLLKGYGVVVDAEFNEVEDADDLGDIL